MQASRTQSSSFEPNQTQLNLIIFIGIIFCEGPIVFNYQAQLNPVACLSLNGFD